MKISFQQLIIGIFAVTAMAAVLGVSPTASASPPLVLAGNDEIQVWVDDLWDVHPSYDDVVISFRAQRSCYATVFVVDTDGYLHVVHPFSPRHNAWVRAGITYRYTAHELGLDALRGAGVAYVFAVGSQSRFDYSGYGNDIFVGGYGYRIWGDPYVACRNMYVSWLPAHCDWNYVSVGSARFYVEYWTRFPSYLCRANTGVHIRVGNYCRSCAPIYDGYRVHVADPYPVMAPRRPVKYKAKTEYASVVKTTRIERKSVTRLQARRTYGSDRVVSRRTRATTRSTVVSTNRTVRAGRQVHWNDPVPELTKRQVENGRRHRTVETKKNTSAAKRTEVKRSTRRAAAPRVKQTRSATQRAKASAEEQKRDTRKRDSKKASSKKAR